MTLHVGRSFTDHRLEDDPACPCPKAPCGLVILEQASRECPNGHHPDTARTLRQTHYAFECPARPDAFTPFQVAALLAISRAPQARVSPTDFALRMWPDSPGWHADRRGVRGTSVRMRAGTALKKLRDQGLVRWSPTGTDDLYALTERGVQVLEARRHAGLLPEVTP